MRAADSAATKIQAGFRGYRVRKQLRLARQHKKSEGASKAGSGAARGMGEHQQKPTAGQPNGAAQSACSAPGNAGDHASSASSRLDMCAAKIQASVRGFLVRRRYIAQHRAASTIQATFRAFRARREARLRAAAKI